jgi:hypothetical protein
MNFVMFLSYYHRYSSLAQVMTTLNFEAEIRKYILLILRLNSKEYFVNFLDWNRIKYILSIFEAGIRSQEVRS